MATIDRIISAVKASSTLMRIVGLNLAVFVLLRLTAIVGIFSGSPHLIDSVLPWLELPGAPVMLLERPWTLLTYMFTQWDLLHVAFNMLWLYWFGTIFLTVSTPARLTALYLSGGLCGAAFFIIGCVWLPATVLSTGNYLLGSSAAVLAIVTAVAILMPRFRMMLFFIGSVEIRWIALVSIVLVLIGVTGSNAGGEVAHLGGIAAGLAYALCLRRGTDLLAPFLSFPSFIRSIFNGHKVSQPEKNSRPTPTGLTIEEREELDSILDKIKKSGYTSLSAAERDTLFSLSKRIR